MRLTVHQLDLKVEDKLKFMSARLQRTERNYDETLDRMDRAVVNFDAFRHETRSEFAEVRCRLDAMDKRFDAMDKRFDAMQEQMDKRFDELQTMITEFIRQLRHDT